MTKEELLQPRYKVIANWPESNLNIGYIEEWVECLHVAKGLWCNYYNQYPHLFKKLEWWEDRKLEDLPLYVKSEVTGKVYENKYLVITPGLCLLPATLEEYLNQSK